MTCLFVAAPAPSKGQRSLLEGRGDSFSVACDRPNDVPTDDSNPVPGGHRLSSKGHGAQGRRPLLDHKEDPSGAGLGGASSDAVAALVALNRAAGNPLDGAGLLFRRIRRVGVGLRPSWPPGPVYHGGGRGGAGGSPFPETRRTGGSAGCACSSSSPPSRYRPRGPTAGWPPRGPRAYVGASGGAEAKLGAWLARTGRARPRSPFQL